MPGATASRPALPGRLITGVGWNLVATVFNQGSTFVIAILAARILGRLAFGEYAMVVSTLVTVTGFAQLATGYTASECVEEFRSSDKVRTGRSPGVVPNDLPRNCCHRCVSTYRGCTVARSARPERLPPGAAARAGLRLPALLNHQRVPDGSPRTAEENCRRAGRRRRREWRCDGASRLARRLEVRAHRGDRRPGAAALVRWLAHAWWLRQGLRTGGVGYPRPGNVAGGAGALAFCAPGRDLWLLPMPAICLRTPF